MCSVATQKRSREEVGLAKLREEGLQQQITKLKSEKTSLEEHKQRMEEKIQQQQAEIGELKAAKRSRTRHSGAGSSSGASATTLDGVCLNTAEIDGVTAVAIDQFLENPPFPELD